MNFGPPRSQRAADHSRSAYEIISQRSKKGIRQALSLRLAIEIPPASRSPSNATKDFQVVQDSMR
jgi:hypothetical protein